MNDVVLCVCGLQKFRGYLLDVEETRSAEESDNQFIADARRGFTRRYSGTVV